MPFKHLTAAALTVACCAATAATAAPAPNTVNAVKRVTINAQPNPITAGDPVVIFGRLFGPGVSGQTVTLYHRLPGQSGFTPVQTTTTDPAGRYAFNRAEGVVETNRAWYVATDGRNSRVVRERVQARVALTGPAPGSTLLTGPAHRVTFTGTVAPVTPGARVVLQRQSAAGGDAWRTIQSNGRVDAGGRFAFSHVFAVPGDANLRAVVKGNARNIVSPSSPVEYQIQQAQNAALTITADPNPLAAGQLDRISGTLRGGAGKQVSLYAATDRSRFRLVAATRAGVGGSYTFTQMPFNNTLYYASGGGRSSARLFVGVRDVLSPVVPSATTVEPGQPVSFTGTVLPDKTGHAIYLQARDATGGDFHTIAAGRVGPGSTYTIVHRFFAPGAHVVRILIPGGPENVGAASPPLTITVSETSLATLVAPLG